MPSTQILKNETHTNCTFHYNSALPQYNTLWERWEVQSSIMGAMANIQTQTRDGSQALTNKLALAAFRPFAILISVDLDYNTPQGQQVSTNQESKIGAWK